MRARSAAVVALGAMAALSLPAGAQEGTFPSRPIRVVVPFTPGTLDVLARSVGQKINDKYGHPVVVDNRPGAATIVGSEIVSKARPDGYTLLMITTTFTINPTLYSKLPYNPQRDFTPITQFDNVFNILVVAANSPLASVADLIAQAKSKPGGLTHASAGVGTAPHIATELLKMTAGIDMTHVPFKGIPEAGTEVMTGRITTLMTTTASASPFLKSGRLKALGVSSAKRLAALPEVPTIAETLPGFQATAFRGLVGPGGVPPAIVRQLATDIAAILRMPDVRDRLVADGGEPVGSTPDEFRAFLRAETEKWGKVIRSAGLKAD